MEKIKIGRIVSAVALKGELKVYNYSDTGERYEKLSRIIVEGNEYEIEKVRYQQQTVILKLSGIDDRNKAETMRNKDVFITEEDLPQLPEDTFYIRDLIGLNVIDSDSGKQMGKLKDVLQNSAQDLYQVETIKGTECLIPAVTQFIKEVNISKGYVKVQLIEGLTE